MTPGQLRIDRAEEAETPTLRVGGELDLHTVDALLSELQAAIANVPALVLDLTGVEFMDSAGVAALNRCRHLSAAADTLMTLRIRAGGPVDQLLTWTGLNSIIATVVTTALDDRPENVRATAAG